MFIENKHTNVEGLSIKVRSEEGLEVTRYGFPDLLLSRTNRLPAEVE